MEDRIKEILSTEYHLIVKQLDSMEGGYHPDETYLLITSDQVKYIVKYIRYSHSFEYLQSILKFENILYHFYEYPCPQIILSKKEELLINDNNRLLFVQTFIEGSEPTGEIIDKDKVYLQQMGRLLAKWRMASREYSVDIQSEEEQQFTDQWWKEQQQMDHLDPFLLINFNECRTSLINLHHHFESGLIHNDFHTNNSIISPDGNIFLIDFIDACHSVFISDLATSLFHLLIDKQYGKYRAKTFLEGYQQMIKLTSEEINILDIFVRFKLTLSIIEDLHHTNDTNHPFIQLCFYLLHTLNNHHTLVKDLLQ